MRGMADVVVITEAVRNEAKKWFAFSDRMEPIARAAEGLTLDVSAFFIGDANAVVHDRAYDGFQAYMVNVLRGAVTEFDQIGAALNKVADAYDAADAVVSLNLNQVWTHQPN